MSLILASLVWSSGSAVRMDERSGMAGDVNSLTAKHCATAGWQLGDDDFVGGILLRITLSFGEKMSELYYLKKKLKKIT